MAGKKPITSNLSVASYNTHLLPVDGTVVVSKRQLRFGERKCPNGSNSCTSNPAGSIQKPLTPEWWGSRGWGGRDLNPGRPDQRNKG